MSDLQHGSTLYMTALFCLALPDSAARRNGAEASTPITTPDTGNRERMASRFVEAQQRWIPPE
jgi:hypothetical protein